MIRSLIAAIVALVAVEAWSGFANATTEGCYTEPEFLQNDRIVGLSKVRLGHDSAIAYLKNFVDSGGPELPLPESAVEALLVLSLIHI
jgi:hypothetical protein